MKLKKKLVVSLFTSFSIASILATGAFAKMSVVDTVADSLSVRTGPGTSYSIIATIYTGTDVVWKDSDISSDGFRYLYGYYPKSSVGKYSSAAMGYIARSTSNYADRYLILTDYAYGTSEPSNTYTNTSLTTVAKSYPKGTQFKKNVRDTALDAEDSNPNAWRASRVDTGNELLYIDGWRSNAQEQP
ncbi:hypothetical protein [Brevibacillus sp. AY1]|uniref:hypothetical protein n=1 Tax=Brevibacillus sp. AY1 TaxID=2807621 RepID=UPI0024588615|nr:hypothetical protein [Brevibacillus sp. AY1]MDH4616589.1 hypothetical protein [Brevibacillus sp. AY1]